MCVSTLRTPCTLCTCTCRCTCEFPLNLNHVISMYMYMYMHYNMQTCIATSVTCTWYMVLMHATCTMYLDSTNVYTCIHVYTSIMYRTCDSCAAVTHYATLWLTMPHCGSLCHTVTHVYMYFIPIKAPLYNVCTAAMYSIYMYM